MLDNFQIYARGRVPGRVIGSACGLTSPLPVNEVRFNEGDGPFILGMDRSPQYDTESAMLRKVVRPDDLERIRCFVKAEAEKLVAAARPAKRIDVVNGLARVVAVRVVGSYSAFPLPTSLR